jgi:putative ergosteryl-3beta-O-L-aspartate hydrolase
LSPGLAPDELLKEALPQNMVMITCWGDGLLHEGEVFRKRLRLLGKRVDGYTVEGVPHGWDKWPSWRKGNVSRDKAYKSAVGSLKEFWDAAAASNS